MRLKRFYHITQVLAMVLLGLCIGAYTTGDAAGMFSFLLTLFILSVVLLIILFLRRRKQKRDQRARQRNLGKARQNRRPNAPRPQQPPHNTRRRGNE